MFPGRKCEICKFWNFVIFSAFNEGIAQTDEPICIVKYTKDVFDDKIGPFEL